MELDKNQLDIVLDNSKSLLVVAGAGCGKSFTIVEKVKYLVNNLLIDPKKILCISFTNDSVNSLRNKLSSYNIDIMTFHKLGINFLKKHSNYNNICSSDYLDYVIDEFFYGLIYENEYLMKTVLKYFCISCYKNIEKKYNCFIYKNRDLINSFKRLISSFIKLFKTNNYSFNDFMSFIKKSIFRKEKCFLIIVINIYLIYINELESSGYIDFDDMIINSTFLLKNNFIDSEYIYVIVDEFQDTSLIRYELLNEIIKKNNSFFIGVGDDFQSIYRFSGCNLNLFLNFNNYFNDCNIKKLERTYRNSKELIYVAGNFIMRNKYQIRKNMVSSISTKKPIKICYGYNLDDLINKINTNIMILGRNNRDINNINCNLYSNKITCLTVHRSKGLEEDNVIIVNVIDSKLGFPNKIEDNKVLRFVSNKNKRILYDEERRLFYVALTRTRNNVFIMTESNCESIFVKELLKNYKSYVEILKK